MINRFEGGGNLGTATVMSQVGVGDEQKKVANMQVYFDRPVGQDYKDKGGFWYAVDIWGYRTEEAVRILKKAVEFS